MPNDDYSFPPGFVPGGDIIITTPNPSEEGGGDPYALDSTPTMGSNNGVTSGGVALALAQREPTLAGAPDSAEDFVLTGIKSWRNLPAWVQQIVTAMNLGGGSEGGGGESENTNYVTQTQLGPDITAAINLNPLTTTRYASFATSIPRSTFSLGNSSNAQVSLVSAPAGCSVAIGETTVAITWVPVMTGEHYIIFWLKNGAKQGQIASLKIVVSAGETVTPIGDLVLISSPVSAGMLVNVYNDGGTPKIRPAIATAVGTIAHAFVTQNAASGQTLVPKYSGVIAGLEGLEAGTRYFLSTTTPGGISQFGPGPDSGHVWQPVGIAISSTELLLDIDENYLRSGS